ncbi:hypothetical protein VFPPC_17216 [Pochonia chlamydosporia 170]|uniref:Uncharacterized protein n=1 Tax=Pochonia chlamydosporia 170 TaxID=1380566 RepID=A0A179EVR0_METCM|nr:hypothetical protein VFPPC_17216 [Pochonia chlamydosporia 170]OAQ57314.1 hypothetical protein VFPPC_17216 [Pochonia chlamydosporia 170]
MRFMTILGVSDSCLDSISRRNAELESYESPDRYDGYSWNHEYDHQPSSVQKILDAYDSLLLCVWLGYSIVSRTHRGLLGVGHTAR